MELKHGTVRLDAAAAWLSKTTGRSFTPDDLIDAHDRLPIYAVIPESKCNPKHSEPVIREFREKAIEVERLTNSHTRSLGGLAAADAGVLRGLFTAEAIAEVAIQRMRPDIALLQKWERAAKRQSVYLLSDEDVSILAANGEVRLGRGVSVFNRWIGRPIQFGNPVDVTPDMLAVRRSQLVKFAEIFAVEQAGNPTAPVCEQEAAKRGTRTDNLKRAIFDAWNNGCPLFPASAIFDYLATKDATGIVMGRAGDEIQWENSSGALSRTVLKSLNNRLPEYRREYEAGG
jgi:hypothetical protein